MLKVKQQTTSKSQQQQKNSQVGRFQFNIEKESLPIMAIEQDFQNTMERKYYCKYGKLRECSL